MHDPRVGRFFVVDPLTAKYPWYTPYQFSGNKVIAFKELEGLEELPATVDEFNDRVENVQKRMSAKAIELGYTENQVSSMLNHVNRSLSQFTTQNCYCPSQGDNILGGYYVGNDGRNLSGYSLLRFLEGDGGYEIWDIETVKNSFMFQVGFKKAMQRLKREAINLSSTGEFDSKPYTGAPQGPRALFSDFGTSIGSFALQGNVFMKEVADGDETVVKGTAYYTLVDTYRWQADRNTLYSFVAGDHEIMSNLTNLGASEFYIRSYFKVNFTLDSQGNFIHTESEQLNSSSDLTNFIDSESNSYQMPENTELKNDYTKKKNN